MIDHKALIERIIEAIDYAEAKYGPAHDEHTPLRVENLARLIMRLDAVKEKNFDMSTWLRVVDEGKLCMTASLSSVDPYACDTAACMAGWMAMEGEAFGVQDTVESNQFIDKFAGNMLQLGGYDRQALFEPHYLSYRTLAEAKSVLEVYWKHGVIRWSKTIDEMGRFK